MTAGMEPSSITQALRHRADQLDNEAVSARVVGGLTEPGRTPDLLEILAAEFRTVADLADHYGS